MWERQREADRAFDLFKQAYDLCASKDGRRASAAKLCTSVLKDERSIARYRALVRRFPDASWVNTHDWAPQPNTDDWARRQNVARKQQDSLTSDRGAGGKVDGNANLLSSLKSLSGTAAAAPRFESGPVGSPLVNSLVPRPHRVTSSDHEPHDLGYFLPDYNKVEVDRDYVDEINPLISIPSSHILLLEVVMAEAPELLAGRVQVLDQYIFIRPASRIMYPDSQGILAEAMTWTDTGHPLVGFKLPYPDTPMVVRVSIGFGFFRQYYPSDSERTGHANIIYVNPAERTIELFEPQGVAEWTSDVIAAIKRSRLFPNWTWVVPTAVCPVQPGVRQYTGPQAQLRMGYCAHFSQQYALFRVLNPGVPAATLNAWLQRGGAEGQLQRLRRMWAWILGHLKRFRPVVYAEMMSHGPARLISSKYDTTLNVWSPKR